MPATLDPPSRPAPVTPTPPTPAATEQPRHHAHHHHERITVTWADIDWWHFTPIALMHAACLAAPFYFSWSGVALAVFLWWACGGLGICLCYHRLLTHRSFKTPKPVEYFLTVLGVLNWQGGPIEWVGMHRLHHKHSDGEEDPHSPKHGFNWAHVLWVVTKYRGNVPPQDAAKDLARDPFLRFIDKYHWAPQIGLAALLYGLGQWAGGLGLSWVVWGVCIRMVVTYHITWFVNSASHTWGYRSHDTDDDSRNLWWVALLSFGEGWHNNHHAHQRAAAHGRRWWEIDPTYITIVAMSWVGLAKDIVRPGR